MLNTRILEVLTSKENIMRVLHEDSGLFEITGARQTHGVNVDGMYSRIKSSTRSYQKVDLEYRAIPNTPKLSFDAKSNSWHLPHPKLLQKVKNSNPDATILETWLCLESESELVVPSVIVQDPVKPKQLVWKTKFLMKCVKLTEYATDFWSKVNLVLMHQPLQIGSLKTGQDLSRMIIYTLEAQSGLVPVDAVSMLHASKSFLSQL